MTREELKKCDGMQVSLILDGKRNHFAFLSVIGDLICISWPPKENQWGAFSPALELTDVEMAEMVLAGVETKHIDSNIRLQIEDGKRMRYLA